MWGCRSSKRKLLMAAYAVPATKCDASMMETLLQGLSCGGVMFCQVLPASRVMWMSPSSVPALFWIGSGKSAEVRRSLIRGTRQIRADDLPAISGVAGFEQDVCREIQS